MVGSRAGAHLALWVLLTCALGLEHGAAHADEDSTPVPVSPAPVVLGFEARSLEVDPAGAFAFAADGPTPRRARGAGGLLARIDLAAPRLAYRVATDHPIGGLALSDAVLWVATTNGAPPAAHALATGAPQPSASLGPAVTSITGVSRRHLVATAADGLLVLERQDLRVLRRFSDRFAAMGFRDGPPSVGELGYGVLAGGMVLDAATGDPRALVSAIPGLPAVEPPTNAGRPARWSRWVRAGGAPAVVDTLDRVVFEVPRHARVVLLRGRPAAVVVRAAGAPRGASRDVEPHAAPKSAPPADAPTSALLLEVRDLVDGAVHMRTLLSAEGPTSAAAPLEPRERASISLDPRSTLVAEAGPDRLVVTCGGLLWVIDAALAASALPEPLSIDAALPLTLPASDRVAVTLTARGGVGAYTFEVVRGGAGLAFTATTSLAIDGRALWEDALARMDRWSPMTFGFEPGAPVDGPSFDIAGYARSTYADALGAPLADALVPVLVPIELAVADADGARDTLTQWLVVLGPSEEFDSLLARKRREAAALAPGDEGQR